MWLPLVAGALRVEDKISRRGRGLPNCPPPCAEARERAAGKRGGSVASVYWAGWPQADIFRLTTAVAREGGSSGGRSRAERRKPRWTLLGGGRRWYHSLGRSDHGASPPPRRRPGCDGSDPATPGGTVLLCIAAAPASWAPTPSPAAVQTRGATSGSGKRQRLPRYWNGSGPTSTQQSPLPPPLTTTPSASLPPVAPPSPLCPSAEYIGRPALKL